MSAATTQRTRAWLRALRLPAQANIAPSLLYGLALAWKAPSDVDLGVLAMTLAFGMALHAVIVFANDVADLETDRRNATATPFSGGSRVLVEGLIHPNALRRASLALAACALMLSAALGSTTFALGSAALGLLWLYSFGPRLSYRGGGALLQAIGIAVVLPLFGFAAASDSALGAQDLWRDLLPLFPLWLASAISTAIPDAPSDRASEKWTVPARFGTRSAGIAVAILHAAGLWLSKDRLGAPTVAMLAIPATVTTLMIGARPGTRAMVVRTFCAILTTIAATVAMAVDAWPG